MARENYELTYLTKDALDDHVQEVANAGSYDKSYIYAILAGTVTDPYAKFRRLYRAIAQTRPEQAQLYLQDLHSLIPDELKEKVHTTQFSEAMGRITKHYLLLQTAASGGDVGEIVSELERLNVMCGKLLMDLNRQQPRPVDAKKQRAS